MGEEISAKFERSYIAIFSQFRLVVVFLPRKISGFNLYISIKLIAKIKINQFFLFMILIKLGH